MKEKISITLDEHLIKFVDTHRGDVPRSKFIENYIRSKTNLFEAIWIFKNEIPMVGAYERWISAHASQPLGKPMHKHEGFIEVAKDKLIFYDQDMDEQFSVEKEKIKTVKVSYDKNFRRFRDSRGFIPPLNLLYDKTTIYLFVRTSGNIIKYMGYNEQFLNALGIKPKMK